jgi:selenocysteine lyase/cysteine desulfurase
VSNTDVRRVGEAVRDEFPILSSATYLNTCSQGALSHRVKAAYEEYLAGWDENGAEWGHWVERAEAVRNGFARLLHAQSDEVAATTSVTQGVNAIVSTPVSRVSGTASSSASTSSRQSGRSRTQELRGAEVVRVQRDSSGAIPPERFAEAIDERTALVCCTTISYRTGHRQDVAAIEEAAHAHGALVLLDRRPPEDYVRSVSRASAAPRSRATSTYPRATADAGREVEKQYRLRERGATDATWGASARATCCAAERTA